MGTWQFPVFAELKEIVEQSCKESDEAFIIETSTGKGYDIRRSLVVTSLLASDAEQPARIAKGLSAGRAATLNSRVYEMCSSLIQHKTNYSPKSREMWDHIKFDEDSFGAGQMGFPFSRVLRDSLMTGLLIRDPELNLVDSFYTETLRTPKLFKNYCNAGILCSTQLMHLSKPLGINPYLFHTLAIYFWLNTHFNSNGRMVRLRMRLKKAWPGYAIYSPYNGEKTFQDFFKSYFGEYYTDEIFDIAVNYLQDVEEHGYVKALHYNFCKMMDTAINEYEAKGLSSDYVDTWVTEVESNYLTREFISTFIDQEDFKYGALACSVINGITPLGTLKDFKLPAIAYGIIKDDRKITSLANGLGVTEKLRKEDLEENSELRDLVNGALRKRQYACMALKARSVWDYSTILEVSVLGGKELYSQVESLEQANLKLADSEKRKSEKCKELREKLKKATSELKEATKNLAKVSKDCEKYQSKEGMVPKEEVYGLQKQLKEQQEAYEALLASKDELSRRVTKSQASIDELEHKVETLSKESEAKSEVIESLKHTNGDLQNSQIERDIPLSCYVNALKGRNIVLVGGDMLHSKLKELGLDNVRMYRAGYKNVKMQDFVGAELIIVATAFVSHSGPAELAKAVTSKGIKVYMFNNKNVERLVYEMFTELNK